MKKKHITNSQKISKVKTANKVGKTKSFTEINKENYKEYVFNKAPHSSHLKNLVYAYIVGGLICTLGQIFIEGFVLLKFSREISTGLASSCLIALAALTTGIGVYDRLGRFAGAGSTIPITGFSNAMVSPALEFRAEGLIYGLGAKMFVVAGPVVVNGVLFSVLIALITLIFEG
ncbi:MAG: SpoVA/SpoVAEb family sporulation membrane protein [Clostridia bacterium]